MEAKPQTLALPQKIIKKGKERLDSVPTPNNETKMEKKAVLLEITEVQKAETRMEKTKSKFMERTERQ